MGPPKSLLYAGRLLTIDEETNKIHIERDAIDYLQLLARSIIVVSLHGVMGNGKTSTVHELLATDNEKPIEGALPPSNSSTSGVWLYVAQANYSNIHYMIILDRQGFSLNPELEEVLYSIMAGLSSFVVHFVQGELTTEKYQDFKFLFKPQVPNEKPQYTLPHGPKLMWLLKNTTISDLKSYVSTLNLPTQDVEQSYLRSIVSQCQEEGEESIQYTDSLQAIFPDQICFPLPSVSDETYDKRAEKLRRTWVESGRNRYMKNVTLNGPLFGSTLVSMLAHRPATSQAFRGKVWKDTIHNCSLSTVETAIKLYKCRLTEQLGSFVDMSDVDEVIQRFSRSETPLQEVELPCETEVLDQLHKNAKRLAKQTFRTMPVRKGKLNDLLKKLFKDLVESLYSKIEEENEKLSSKHCCDLLEELHESLRAKVDKQLENQTSNSTSFEYAAQSSEFKRFFINYQHHIHEMMINYSERAVGPVKKKELSKFLNSTVRMELIEFSEKLENIRQKDINRLEENIEDNEQKREIYITEQKATQKETMNVQTSTNQALLKASRVLNMKKEAVEGAIFSLDEAFVTAKTQQQLLEQAAVASIAKPEEQLRQVLDSKEDDSTQHQGYLTKLGGGGLMGIGKNWKRRWFVLNQSTLAYAETKDEYERGNIIKTLNLKGCQITPARNAADGIDIIPPSGGEYMFEMQKGYLQKNAQRRASKNDAGRVFQVRAPTIDDKDKWIEKLRKGAK